MIKREMPFW